MTELRKSRVSAEIEKKFEEGVVKAFRAFSSILEPVIATSEFVENGSPRLDSMAVMQALITLGAKVAQWNKIPREDFASILGVLLQDSQNPESDIFLESRAVNKN